MAISYQPHVYLIRTLTNLHVGGGSSNYDYVDKQVQRDPTTNYPTIFSSGLKGAIRDHFFDIGTDKEIIAHIFGNEPGDSDPKQGAYRFLSADLLAIPQPAATDIGYQRTYVEANKQDFEDKIKLMGASINGLNAAPLGTPIDKAAFDTLVQELPVLSRNHLENGVSKNLWYEEVVPRETLFGVAILAPTDDGHFEAFNATLTEQIIQIGANATIGYGLCKFQKL